MNTVVMKHEVERSNALGQRTGEPSAQKGAKPEATVPLLSAAAELVAALEAFEIGQDSSGQGGRKDESREPSGPVASVTGTPSLRLVNPSAHSAGPQTRAHEVAAARSPEVTLLPAWRDYIAQFRAPNTRFLVITAKDQTSLYDFFRRTFAGVETVEVRMDRRRGERRPPEGSVAVDGRQADRRSRPQIDAELRASGFAFVRSVTRPDVERASSSRGEQPHPPAPNGTPAAVEQLGRSPFRRASSAH